MRAGLQIRETRALETGGLFVASSSEINPPIPVENYLAMVNAVGEHRNTGLFADSESVGGLARAFRRVHSRSSSADAKDAR